MKAYSGGSASKQPPTDTASRAYALHAALMRLARDFPELEDDAMFRVFRMCALQRFEYAFEAQP